MECTGERYMPEFDGDWTLEHTHRYLLACEYAWNKCILDIACGDGYGARMLADVAAKVIGVDISFRTLVRSVVKYPHPRLSFLQGSVTSIPLASKSVDLVTSFETIEHLLEHEAMLSEVHRVLRPDGMVIISSPDKYEYSDLPGYTNPYHLKELYKDEFEHLLRQYFPHIRLVGQRVVFGSVMGAEEEGCFVSWNKGQDARSTGLSQAEYIVALAGANPLPSLPSSIVKSPLESCDRVKKLNKIHENTEQYAQELEKKLEIRNKEIAQLCETRDALQFDVNWLKEWKERAHIRMETLESRLESQILEVRNIHRSRSWRITAPLRFAATWLRRFRPPKPMHAIAPVGSWPPDVRALQKSITLNGNSNRSALSLGVFIHIYYTELSSQIVSYLHNIPEHAHIYISTDSEEKRHDILSACAQAGLMHRIDVRVCPNQGWDIAPFLIGFADEIPKYSLILRLHSKRSTHIAANIGDSWRQMLFSSLAGTVSRVNAVMDAFEKDSSLGMVCAQQPAFYADKVNFGANYPLMSHLLRSYNIYINLGLPIDFPMGSMFWCRPEVLKPWLDKKFTYEDFSQYSEDKRDGSLAHALERLLFFGCGIAGFSWARIDTPSENNVGES